MNVPVMITDNVTELLVKIISFTEVRRKVITGNINNMRSPDFAPTDLDVNEFSQLLNHAIDEHTRNNRLVLCDTDTIKFGKGGSFEVKPVFDKYAKELLDRNQDEYIEHQINKLLENALNQKVAETLLRQKEGITTDFE